VDVNNADAEQLITLLQAIGIERPRADSMADALLDWRDPDDVPRALGAERDWYRAAGRFMPRNGPLADVRELRQVRGFDVTSVPDSLLGAIFTVEPGRLLWNRAPIAVLASVPGLSDEALARIAERRAAGMPLSSATDLAAVLSPTARQLLESRWSDVQGLTGDRPDAWVLTARSGMATIELRLAAAGARAAVVRRRTTP
jgi:general secretion pathway protein K